MRGAIRKVGAFDRLTAAFLAVAMSGYWIPAGAYAGAMQGGPAEIRGAVLQADGLTAVAGVNVKAANVDTRQIYSSASTGKDGAYSLKGLPPGSYDLAVETPEGLYAADQLVVAGAGKTAVVSLALRPGIRQEGPQEGEEQEKQEGQQGAEEEKKEAGKEEAPPEPEPQQGKTKKKRGAGFWRSPGGAAIAIVVGAALVGAAANAAAGDDDNDEEPMSAAAASSVPR